MADKLEAEQADEKKPKKKSRKNIIMGGVLLGVMGFEALVVFVLVKHFTAPPLPAEASGPAGLNPDDGEALSREKEVQITKFRALNDKTQRPVMYDLTVFARVSEADAVGLEKLVESRSATIRDRFSSVVRSADPKRFQEPDLATLRQEIKQELSKIAGEDLIIREVLIPSIMPYID